MRVKFATAPERNPRLAKSSRSRIGDLTFDSTSRSKPRETTAARAKATVDRDAHPHSGPWTTAETNKPMPTIIRRKPAQSTRSLASLRTASRTLNEQSKKATVTIGILTKNIHRHDRA